MKNNEENIIYIDDGSRKISILISNKRYDVIISAGNLLLPRFNVDDNFNYRQYVSNELLKAIQSEDRPQIEDIEIQDSEFFEKIFDVLLLKLRIPFGVENYPPTLQNRGNASYQQANPQGNPQ